MGMALSILVVGGGIVLILYVLHRQNAATKSQYGPAGLSEFRTDLALDACMDALDAHDDADVFAYDARRDPDGSYLLHLTLHKPTEQPLDTLYSLRFDAGKQTVITLIFLREAFGYKEPVFPPEMLDAFMAAKFAATRTK